MIVESQPIFGQGIQRGKSFGSSASFTFSIGYMIITFVTCNHENDCSLATPIVSGVTTLANVHCPPQQLIRPVSFRRNSEEDVRPNGYVGRIPAALVLWLTSVGGGNSS
jgi:hypothetical protein